MAFQFKKPHPSICTIKCGDKGYIYKIAIEDSRIMDLENEYMMIQKMIAISDIFKTFEDFVDCDLTGSRICFPFYSATVNISKRHIKNAFDDYYKFGFSIMYCELNENLATFYNYCYKQKMQYIPTLINILHIVHTIFRPNNFIHGDFKGNNIMIDKSDNSIKIIDLDFSLICSDNNAINDYNLINLYLGPCIVTKEYLFLFDMWIFATSILGYRNFFPSQMHQQIKKYYNNPESIITDTFMDFFVIYNIIYEYGCSMSNVDGHHIDGAFKIINEKLLQTPMVRYDDRYDEHVIKVQKIIRENDLSNVKKVDELANVFIDDTVNSVNSVNSVNLSTMTLRRKRSFNLIND